MKPLIIIILVTMMMHSSLSHSHRRQDNTGNQILADILSNGINMQGEQFNEFVLDVLNTIQIHCDLLTNLKGPLLANRVKPHKIKMIAYTQLGSFTHRIKCIECLVESRNFDVNYKTIIFIPGYNSIPYDPAFETMASNYLKYPGYNFISLDISKYMRGSYLNVVATVPRLGQIVGDFLVNLVNYGVDPNNIHIIGYSLGAQIAGIASRVLQNKMGLTVSRITALDPANICFQMSNPLTLKKSDAEYVDAVHTSVLSLYRDNIGHADFHVNGNIVEQPGCEFAFIACSHRRNLLLYIESIVSEESFLAVKCDSWGSFVNGNCSSDYIAVMGAASHPKTRGKFYLRTGHSPPFGLGYDGLK